MDIFRVPQRKIAGRVWLGDGRELTGTLYTAETGADGAPGRLVDRLNDPRERFLPMRDASGGLLLAKSAIAAVCLALPGGEGELHEGEHEFEATVRLTLRGGPVVEGRLGFTMPPEKRRLIDYLNAAPEFVVVIGRDEAVLVNVEGMIDIQELG